jgi:hypothetical protein
MEGGTCEGGWGAGGDEVCEKARVDRKNKTPKTRAIRKILTNLLLSPDI